MPQATLHDRSRLSSSGRARPTRICFVALNAYPAVSGRKDIPHIGGAEVQQALIARGLLQNGHEVSFVTLDHGQDDGEEHAGMRVFKAHRPGSGLPFLRTLHPKITMLWAAMRRADADIYYNRMSEFTAGVVASFCKRHGRRFIFATAHKWDCIPSLPTCGSWWQRALYRHGLRSADLVISQTREQQQLLGNNFGVDSLVLPNCGQDSGCLPGRGGEPGSTPPPRLLWAGRFAREKNLDRLLELASLCRDLHFDVVGDGDTELARRFKADAAGLPNVHHHGRVPHEEMVKFYSRASCLLCTSVDDGFPNIFLEAWGHGLPVVSTFDADGMIADHGLGIFDQEIPALAGRLKALLGDAGAWREACRRARRYFVDHLTVEAMAPRYAQLIESLAQDRSTAC